MVATMEADIDTNYEMKDVSKKTAGPCSAGFFLDIPLTLRVLSAPKLAAERDSRT
jgi:hypothetical protein